MRFILEVELTELVLGVTKEREEEKIQPRIKARR